MGSPVTSNATVKQGELTTSLMEVVQGYNDSLRDHLKSFREAVAEIKKLNIVQAIAHLAQGLNVHTAKRLIKDTIAKRPQL